MKRMKRLVALLVTIATIASLCTFSIPVSAEETADTLPAVTVADEDILRIEKLEALGVIDASYDPATYVTRRKMADIIVKYMNITPSANSNGTPFRDVTMKDSSFASICTLYNMGIISGDEELRFKPDNYVTYDEALVFLVNAVGHKMFAEREGGYPTGYHRVAIKHNMLKGISMQKGTDPVHFPDLYKMLEAALDAAVVERQYYGDGSVQYTLSETDTYLYATYGIRKYHGIVTGNENTKLTSADSHLTDEQIEIDGQLYETPGYVYDYFLGYAVDYYVKVNSETDALMVYIEEADKFNEVVKIDAEDILPAKTTSSRIYYTDEENQEKEYHITFDTNFDVIYNKQCWLGYGSLRNAIPATGYVEALDNNGDGAYDVLFVCEYRNIIVQSTNSFNESVTDKITGDVIDIDSVDNEVVIHFAGETKKRNFSSIQKDAVLSMLISKGTEKVITIYISTEVVNGMITGYSSDLGYEIGEGWYEPAYNYYDAAAGGTDLAMGLEGDFYLDMNGDIVTYKYAIPENDTSVLGLVAGIQPSESRFNPDITLKIFTQDGEFYELNLSLKVKINGYRYDLEKADGTYGRNAALTALNASIVDGQYAITDTYLIKYNQAKDGTIASIDTGAQGGEGNLNTIISDTTGRFLGRTDMLILNYSASQENKLYTRANSPIVFYAPISEKIDDTDLYEIKEIKFNGERYYGPGQSYMDCQSYSVYSLGTTEIPTVDVIVCKSGSSTTTVPSANSSMGVITGSGYAADELGMSLTKLYLNSDESVVLNKVVKVWDSVNTSGYEYTDSSVLTTGTTPVLKVGTIIQYETNFEGLVDRIMIVAEYINGTLTPKTSWTAHNGQAHHTVGESSNSQTDNVLFGEVLAYDADAKLIQVKLGTHTNVAFKSGGTVYMYITKDASGAALANPRMVGAKLSDIGVNDKFIAKLDSYFNLDTMIILR